MIAVNYIDSNVFIFAALDQGPRGTKSREIIRTLCSGELRGITSALTVDEVVWKIWQQTKNRREAIKEGQRILRFDNLSIADAGRGTMHHALELMSEYELKPRDAIHLAVALSSGCSAIISDDADFDRIKEIKRIKLD